MWSRSRYHYLWAWACSIAIAIQLLIWMEHALHLGSVGTDKNVQVSHISVMSLNTETKHYDHLPPDQPDCSSSLWLCPCPVQSLIPKRRHFFSTSAKGVRLWSEILSQTVHRSYRSVWWHNICVLIFTFAVPECTICTLCCSWITVPFNQLKVLPRTQLA